ncbi:MAG: alpha/beta hydrolase [Myxococcota bacterium]
MSLGRSMREAAEGRRRRGVGCGQLVLSAAFGLFGVVGLALGVVVGWVHVDATLRERDSAEIVAPGSRVHAHDVDLYVSHWGPRGGRPVVLIHGSGAWGGAWEPVARVLADAGYHVIAPDLPPFGFSERPADATYDAPSQAARITGLLQTLDLQDVALVGHSFGGGPTVEAAARAEGRVTQLVLIDAALGLPPRDDAPRPVASVWVRAGAAVPFVRHTLVAATLSNPAFMPTGLRAMVHDPTTVTDDWIARYRRPLTVRRTSREVGRWVPSLLTPGPSPSSDPATYRALAVPTLVVWGSDDEATPLAQGERVTALLPDAELVVLAGVGHIPQIEDPEGLDSSLLDFLAR